MLARSSRRYLFRHPWLTALSLVGVALGVAVVVAVDLANASATRAFRLSSESLTGRATHTVVGGPGGVSGDLYARIAVDLGVTAAPVVEGFARAEADSARVLQILGIDAFAEADFRPYIAPRGDSGVDLPGLLTTPGGALLSSGTAEELGLDAGDAFPIRVDGRAEEAVVLGILTPEDESSASALRNLLIVDISTAQEWVGRADLGEAESSDPGLQFRAADRLSRIDLLIPDGADSLLASVEAVLPEGLEVREASEQADALETMTAAFRLNLTALSLLALVVGLFLIYNTVTFTVVQRRKLLGTYRALGVTRREVFRLVIGEALVVGAAGTAIGLALGIVLGTGLVRLVTQTIGDLYFVVRVRDLSLDPWSLAKGVGLGLGASVLGALRPGWEAASVAPASALRRSQQEDALAERSGRLALAGLATVIGGAVLIVATAGIVWAYIGLLLVIVGAALAAPWATRLFSGIATPVLARVVGPTGRMAARGVTASLSRTAIAVAALAVAVASTVGVGVMVSSFRVTVEEWLGSVLQADVYIQPPATVFRRGGGFLDPAVALELRQLEGVARADGIRTQQLDTDLGPVDLIVAEVDSVRAGIYRYKEGEADAVARATREGAVAVSEPFAFRSGLGRGDTLRIPTDRGERAYPIAGVYYDYGNDLGVVLMHEETFLESYRDPGLSGLALTAEAGVDPEALTEAARAVAEGRQQLVVRSNRSLRQASLDVFDQTFVVTNVLRLLAVLVAFVGVLSALMALQLERRRELAMLRAQGMTRREVARMVFAQTGLMGLWAGALALPLGLALAAVLVFVVNVRSFGWTLAFTVDPWILVQAVVLAVVAALLAGAYPAWAMGRSDPALAMREE
ncbi:MAG: FtsX-like permease family protein [Bacteroidota bacterium]